MDALAREPNRVGERSAHWAHHAGGRRWHLVRYRPNAAGTSLKARFPHKSTGR